MTLPSSSHPNDPLVLCRQRQRHLEWRMTLTNYRGDLRLSIWPFFAADDGDWRPCSPKYGGGLQVPFERLPELVSALELAMAEGGAE